MAIQETLANHGRRLDALPRIERQLSDINEGMVTALGLAAQANVRHDHAGAREDELTRIDELQRRIEVLEEKV